MSFSSQETKYCLLDHFNNSLLILCMKAIKKRKGLQFNKSKNKENLGFDEHDSDRYISFPLSLH